MQSTPVLEPHILDPQILELDTVDGGAPDAEPALVRAPPRRPRWQRATERLQAGLFALLGIAGFLAIWSFISWRAPDLPSPVDSFSELGTLLGRAFESSGPNGRGIMLQLGTSLGRTLQGFAYAALVAIPLGLFIGGNRRAWQAANPVIQILRPISPLAWFPLGLVVLKDSPGAAVFVIFITALWPTVLNTAAGAASVPLDQRNVARVFHFGRLAYWRHVMIPHAVPSIVTGLRLSMGTAWMVIVAAEMLSGGSGIGFFVWDSYNGGNLSAVIAAVIIIGVVGVILDHMFVAASRRYTREGIG
jgi:nitrate/nitrite transport system permease protein